MLHGIRWTPLIVAIVCAFTVADETFGTPSIDPLRRVAVYVVRTPPQAWPGYGIYLGRGLVITAAHVVGDWHTSRPQILIAGQALNTKLVKEGRFEDSDLTLLAVDETRLPDSLRHTVVVLCDSPPVPGQRVTVAIPEGTAPSTIVAPDNILNGLDPRFNTLIADVATTGQSGSGIFDADSGCLLGIMSRKITRQRRVQTSSGPMEITNDLAKYFVSARIIRDFLPPDATAQLKGAELSPHNEKGPP